MLFSEAQIACIDVYNRVCLFKFKGDKLAQQTMRADALERYAKRAEDLKNEKATMKHKNGRFSVRQQMEVNPLYNFQSDVIIP